MIASAASHVELVQPSHWFSMGGLWSGTQGRHNKQFIALIPICRYNDPKPRVFQNCVSSEYRQRETVKSVIHIHNARFNSEAPHNFTETLLPVDNETGEVK